MEQRVQNNKTNTNFTASCFLMRTGLVLGPDGNPRVQQPGSGNSLRSRNMTIGPLTLTDLGTAKTRDAVALTGI